MANPSGSANPLRPDTEAVGAMARTFIETATPFFLNSLAALVVFIVGMWVAGRAKKALKTYFAKSSRIDATLEGFLSSVVYYALIGLVVITTLGVFGVPTTSFAAVIGAAGLAIGLALQGTLGHVASGVMLLGLRPFKVGDFVDIGGESGAVKEISLFTTTLATVDNKKVIVPNGQILSDSVTNYSAYDTRRVDLVFGVSYADDLNKALQVVQAGVAAETRGLAEPSAVVAVDNLGESSVEIICRVWVKTEDYFPVKWALTKDIKERLDDAGVSIPFPTRTLLMTREADADAA